FLHLNTSKRSVVRDGLTEDAFERLLSSADVLLLGGTPAELDPHELHERYPSAVVTAITWFGLDGPYAAYAGNELIAYAISGYMMLTGAADREPIKAYGELLGYQA